MRQLYLLSKPFDNKPRLIGVLSEIKEGKGNEKGDYKFEYKLGNTLPEWFLQVDEFPDIAKTYTGGEVLPFINRVIPKQNDKYINSFFKSAKIDEYNEWELLKYCGKRLYEDDTSLSEILPKDTIVYDQLEN